MPPRVDDVETGGDDADHAASRVECALVHRGIDPDGQAAHHRDSGASQSGTQLACIVEPVRRRRARPHDRHTRTIESAGIVTLGEQHLGPVGECFVDRIAGTAGHEHARVPSNQRARGAIAAR